MQQRQRLGAMKLEGGHRAVRNIMFWALAGIAALGALGYVLPAHRVYDDATFHSNFADGGPASLLVFTGVLAVMMLLRGRRFGAGILAGALAMAGAIGAVIPVILVHFMSSVQHGPGEPMFALGVLGLFFGGGILIIAEPILFLTQRRARERAARALLPQLPIARVVS